MKKWNKFILIFFYVFIISNCVVYANENADAKLLTVDATEIDLGDYQQDMLVGEKQLLSITVLPKDATNQNVSYESSDEGVATINGMGRINAVSEGTTQIIAKCGTIQNSFTLNVKQTNEVAATDIEIGYFDAEMFVGNKQTLSVNVIPSNATNKTVSFESSNTSIVSVLSTGEIKAITKGTASITVSTGSISKQVIVTVKEEDVILAEEIDLGDYQEVMLVGEKQLISSIVLPTNTTKQTLTYESNDKKVAIINELGRITAVSQGSAIITVKCGSIENSFKLIVKKSNDINVEGIEIGNYKDEMKVDEIQTISVIVKPSNATDLTVRYSSSNSKIATVLSTGEVKAIAVGTVSITVKAGEITRDIMITVKTPTTKIDVSKNYVVLKPNEEVPIMANAIPKDAVQEMTYESVDTDVAIVTPKGVIQAKSIGSTSIIVSNGELSVAITVIVNESGIADQANIEKASKETLSSAIQYKNVYDEQLMNKILNDNSSFKIEVDGEKYPILNKDILKELYKSNKEIHIVFKDYTLVLKGSEIINYENELSTNINYAKEDKKISFVLNDGKNLPGVLVVKMKESNYHYLYLWNEVKNRYQKIQINDFSSIKFDTTGRYIITMEKLDQISVNYLVIIIVLVILIVLIFLYIMVKKQYWFW